MFGECSWSSTLNLFDGKVECCVTHTSYHVIGKGNYRSTATSHAVDEDVVFGTMGTDETCDPWKVLDEFHITICDTDTKTGTSTDTQRKDLFTDSVTFDDGHDSIHVIHDLGIDEGTNATDPQAILDLIDGVFHLTRHEKIEVVVLRLGLLEESLKTETECYTLSSR
jgi:hypothetical protein